MPIYSRAKPLTIWKKQTPMQIRMKGVKKSRIITMSLKIQCNVCCKYHICGHWMT